VKVTLINAVDESLAALGQLPSERNCRLDVDALVDTGAVSAVLPIEVVDRLGLAILGHRVAQFADGRKEPVNLVGPVIFEALGRKTVEEPLVLGDQLLSGQTVLEKTDLLADCQRQRLVPNPARPDQPVLHV